jgi:predicted nuclease with TOPRIM domain
MQYYQLDPVTLQPTRDPTTGLKMTSGPGTMQEILDDQLAKSAAQLARLNETRQQLTDLREELVRSITELNERKGTLRARLKDIVDLNGKIAGLEAKIRQLEGEIDGLKQEKRALETQVADLQGQVDKANQEKADLEELNNKLKKEIKDLREGKGVTPQPTMASGEVIQRIVRMEPGDKGEVLAVNPTWNFVVVKLSDECLGEVFDEQGILTPVELYVKRAPAKEGKEDKFITKIRLIQASRSQKVGIADILSDWQQAPVQDGDVIFR